MEIEVNNISSSLANQDGVSEVSNAYLFKNGYGMIVKSFELPSSSTEYEILNPPANPVHGTLWIQSTPNSPISSICTKQTKKFDEEVCVTVIDLFEANLGQDVDIYTNLFGQPDWFTCKPLSVQTRNVSIENHVDTSIPHSPYPIIPYYSHPVQQPKVQKIEQRSGNLLMVQTNDGVIALPATSLLAIRSTNGTPLKMTFKREKPVNCLSVRYQSIGNSSGHAVMKYLTYGITWAPSYNLILLPKEDNNNSKVLRLSAKATILNDSESIKVKELSCIAGFPNIKFEDVTDPLSRNDTIREFLTKLTNSSSNNNNNRYNRYNNPMSNNVMLQQQAPVMAQGMMPMSNSAGPSGVADNDDLHLYQFNDVTLDKRERVCLPMFDIELPYKDVYLCSVEAETAWGYRGSQSNQNSNSSFEEVWHAVEFVNKSTSVWTTAPVLLTKGHQFVGQDTLTYTLPGGTALVNITKALGIQVSFEETLLSKRGTVKIGGYHFEQENITGKFTITSYKKDEVNLVIKANLLGDLSECSIKPKEALKKAGYEVANSSNKVRWELPVGAGSTVVLTYVRLVHKRT